VQSTNIAHKHTQMFKVKRFKSENANTSGFPDSQKS